jgi:hypothetical protein
MQTAVLTVDESFKCLSNQETGKSSSRNECVSQVPRSVKSDLNADCRSASVPPLMEATGAMVNTVHLWQWE